MTMDLLTILALINIAGCFYWISVVKPTSGFVITRFGLFISATLITGEMRYLEINHPESEFKKNILVSFVSLDKNIMTLANEKKVYKFYVEKDILDLHVFKKEHIFFIKPKMIVSDWTGGVAENVLFRDFATKPELISMTLENITHK